MEIIKESSIMRRQLFAVTIFFGMGATVCQAAVEFDAPEIVNDFNLSGNGSDAVYIGKNSFVRNVSINAGAKIFGDIVSEWNVANRLNPLLPREGTTIEFDGKIYDASKFNPDLVEL